MNKFYIHKNIKMGTYARFLPPEQSRSEALDMDDGWNGLIYMNKHISNGDRWVVVPTWLLTFNDRAHKEKWLADKTYRDGYYLFCYRGEDTWLPYLNENGSNGQVLDCCLGIAWSEKPFPGIEYSEEMKR